MDIIDSKQFLNEFLSKTFSSIFNIEKLEEKFSNDIIQLEKIKYDYYYTALNCNIYFFILVSDLNSSNDENEETLEKQSKNKNYASSILFTVPLLIEKEHSQKIANLISKTPKKSIIVIPTKLELNRININTPKSSKSRNSVVQDLSKTEKNRKNVKNSIILEYNSKKTRKNKY